MALDSLQLEVRQLRIAVAELLEEQQHLARMLLEPSDRRLGSALVPLLAEVFGLEEFTASKVAALALNDRTAAGQALRELVAEHVTDESGLRGFGRQLSRLQGVSFAGCRLVAAGSVRGVAQWRVRVSGA